MAKRSFLLLISLFTFTSRIISADFHAFHTSLAQVNYNATGKVFEISLRVFTDDLETALTREAARKIKLDDTTQNDPVLIQYLQRQFGLMDANGQKKKMSFVGKEFEADATWIYLEIPAEQSLSGMSLQNALLTEVFGDQTNVVNLTFVSSKKTYLFKADNTVQTLH